MRLFLKIFMFTALALIVIVGGSYLYLFKFGGIENIVSNKVDSLVKEKYKLDIKFGKITGSFFSQLVIEDINIFYDDSVNHYQLLKLPRVTTTYSIANLWNKKYILEYLNLDSAEITLVKDKNGEWVIPDFSPKSKKKVEMPSFSIGSLNFNDFTVTLLDDKDTISFDNLFLSLAFKGAENTMSVNVDKFEFTSNQKKISLDAGGGKVTYADKQLIFQDVLLAADNWRTVLGGIVSFKEEKPTGRIQFEADQIDFADISIYIKPNLRGVVDLSGEMSFVGSSLEGAIHLNGTFMMIDFKDTEAKFRLDNKILYLDSINGTILDSCQVSGSGFVDFNQPKKVYHLEADIKNFNLNNLVKQSFNSDLTGHIILNGESFKKKDMTMEIEVNLSNSSFHEYPLQKASGKFNVTTDSITFLDWFQVHYFENIFYANGNIEYKNNIDLDIIALLENLDRYKGKLFIDQPGGRGYSQASLYGLTKDPGLKGKFSSDSLWLYGMYSDSAVGSFEIDRFLSGRKGQVEISFYKGNAWAVPFDSSYSLINIDSNIVTIDSSFMVNQYTNLDAKGTYDYMAVPGLLNIDTLYFKLVNQVFYNRSGIVVEVDTLGFNFTQAAIGSNGSMLAANGRVNYDETMNMLLSLNKIPIKPWKNIFEDSISIDGFLSSEASLTGSFASPEFVLNAVVDSLTYNGLLLGNSATKLSYVDKKLTIDSLLVYSDSGSYRADGNMFMDLSFTTGDIDRFPDLPMNINIEASDREFDLVSFVLPSVEEITGDFHVDFTLSGTPQQPHLEGEAFIRGYAMTNKDNKKVYIPASLKYFDLEEHIYTDSAGVTMTDNLIVIDTVPIFIYRNKVTPHKMLNDGDKGKTKNMTFIDGTITVKALDNFYYNLDVVIPKPMQFTYDLDDIKGRILGTLHIEGDTPPLVTGDVELTEMKYLVNFVEIGEGSPILMAFAGENTWDLDIDINILSNYWIKNIDIDAEFSGEIKLQRTKGIYSFGGEMQILRGSGYLFDKTFNLEPGGKVTFTGEEDFNPNLDMIGYTFVTGTRDELSVNESSERLRLGINITGTLEEPIINVTEDSDFGSNEDIIPLLVANYAGAANVSNGIENRIGNLLSSQVSQIATRNIGIETFEIDPHYRGKSFDASQTRVTLGKYLSPKGYGYYRTNFSQQYKFEVGFEYRLNKSFLIQGLRDEDELYHLNLKLNMEFR